MNDELRLHHLLGLNSDLRDNVAFYLDELDILYAAGRCIVCYNVEKRTQRFIRTDLCVNNNNNNGGGGNTNARSNHRTTITTMALYISSRHKYLAIAESGDRGVITVCDISQLTTPSGISVTTATSGSATGATTTNNNNGRRKIERVRLSCSQVMSREYVSLCFSNDGKQLLAQSGGPDWTLVNFLWSKNKVLQVAQVSNAVGAPINQISLCPTDSSTLCVCGDEILRFLRLEHADFKSLPFSMGRVDPQNYVCHTWIDERIIVGTDTGDIMVFENGDFRGILKSSPSNGKSIECITASSKGFLCGCDEAVVYLFERDEKEIYKEVRSFKIANANVKVKNLALSPSEDTVMCVLDNSQAYTLSLANTDILKPEDMSFELLPISFHSDSVHSMDLCVRKSLAATSSADRTVRIWNYHERHMEAVQTFKEQPYVVAMHPLGLQVLMAFTETLQLANIFIDEIRVFKEFSLKRCGVVHFSNGGQFFAAASNQTIFVYHTYSHALKAQFHAHKGRVTELEWQTDDNTIVSCSADGSVLTWNINDGQVLSEFHAENRCAINGVTVATDDANVGTGLIYAIGADNTIRAIKGSEEVSCVKLDCTPTRILLPPVTSSTLYVGTATGKLRIVSLPLDGAQIVNSDVHNGAISALCASFDCTQIFTGSVDGCLSMFNIQTKERSGRRRDMLTWSEDILIGKLDLETKLAQIEDLQRKVEELKDQNAMQLRVKELNYQERLREVTEKFHHELESDKERYASLESSKLRMESHYAQTLSSLDRRHHSKTTELENHQRRKVASEHERYEQLKASFKTQQKSWDAELENEKAAVEQNMSQLKRDHAGQLRDTRAQREAIERSKEDIVSEFEETKHVMEEVADSELDELRAQYDQKLTLERVHALRLKDENHGLKDHFRQLKEQIDEQRQVIKKKEQKQRALYDQIRGLERDSEGHIKEIKERDSTVRDKVKRIFELRKKNQELEKFKFVLKYKIKELMRQIKPSQDQMVQMEDQMGQMKTELSDYKKNHVHLQLEVKERRLKLKGVQNEIERQADMRRQLERRFARSKLALQELHSLLDTPKELKEATKRLYRRLITHEDRNAGKDQTDQQEIFRRQRNYLEKNVDALRNKMRKDLRVQEKNRERIMQENIVLIKEINSLRREVQMMRQQQDTRTTIKQTPKQPQSTPRTGRSLALERQIADNQETIRALQGQLAHLTLPDHQSDE